MSAARYLAFVALVATGAGACGTTTADLTRVRRGVGQTEAELRMVRGGNEAGRRYRALISGQQGGAGRFLVLGKGDLGKAIVAATPYQFRGEAVDKRLRGEFMLDRPRDLRVMSRDRLTFRLRLRGRRIQVALKGYDKMKRELIDALQHGADVEVGVRFRYDKKRNAVAVQSQANSVRLSRHDSANYRNMVRNGLNSRLFREMHYIPLPDHVRGAETTIFTTPHHVIVAW